MADERDYIDRTIATVRNHRDADNCWPQWANIFADEIESLRANRDRLVEALRDLFSASQDTEHELQVQGTEYANAARFGRAIQGAYNALAGPGAKDAEHDIDRLLADLMEWYETEPTGPRWALIGRTIRTILRLRRGPGSEGE